MPAAAARAHRWMSLNPHTHPSLSPLTPTSSMPASQSCISTCRTLRRTPPSSRCLRCERNACVLDGVPNSCYVLVSSTALAPTAFTPTHPPHTLCRYLQRTHASTHKNFSLSIIDAFCVSRHCESERFEPWLDLHNHQVCAANDTLCC